MQMQRGAIFMRAGRLATRRYKVRRGYGGWIGLAAVCLLLVIAGYALRQGWITLSLPVITPEKAAATHPPQDLSPQERAFTLPGQSWFALQLGAFDQLSSAQSVADGYRSRGAGGYLLQQGSYRVLAAAYATRAEAQAVQNQLKTQHGVEAVITEIVRPEITLHLTGQAMQLTALTDAYDAVDQLIGHLNALFLSLDQGQADTEAILAALRSERDTAAALASRLDTLFAGAGHPAVRNMASLLEDIASALDGCLSAQGRARLGAQVKYCHLLCVCRMAAYAEGLAP